MKPFSLKIVTVGLSAALLIGCTSNTVNTKPQQPVDKKPLLSEKMIDPAPVKIIAQCKLIQRDLSSTWRHREYWCNKSGRVIALNGRDEQYVNLVRTVNNSTAKLSRLKTRLNSAVQQMNNEIGVEQKIKKIKEPVQLTPIPVELKETHSKIKHKANTAYPTHPFENPTISKVWFAKNLEVLGPQGLKAAHTLITAANLAAKVTLRGYVKSSEVDGDTSSDFERFSVGRSLSVKALFISKGVDLSKIKILHHKRSPEGRYVEVNFDG